MPLSDTVVHAGSIVVKPMRSLLIQLNTLTTNVISGLEQSVYADFMFLDNAKNIRDIVHNTNSLQKNASRIFEVYEDIFGLRQGDHWLII